MQKYDAVKILELAKNFTGRYKTRGSELTRAVIVLYGVDIKTAYNAVQELFEYKGKNEVTIK